MDQPQPLNEKQRAAFARLVEEAKKREVGELESESDFDDRIESEFLPQLAEEHGASTLIAKIRKLNKEVEEAEEALSKLGFSCGDDSISLRYSASKNLTAALAEAKRAARKERQQAFKKYDRAILGIWATEDAQEAKRIVEGILS